MNKRLLFSLLVITIITLPLFTGIEGIKATPGSESTTTPKYGGSLVRRIEGTLSSIDLDVVRGGVGGNQGLWAEVLFAPNWNIDRSVFAFNDTTYVPFEYCTGMLAESWEWTDPQTFTIHLRKGVHWHDKPPVNGREFTADDVVYTFHRLMGTGHGFTKPNPYYVQRLSNIEQVTADDNYTVAFKFKKASYFATDPLIDVTQQCITMIAHEWAELGEEGRADWRNAVGTGAWQLTGFVSGVSLTFSRNPDYWGVDEHYPDNRLPYIDTFKEIAIADDATALAAMRSGQIDLIIRSIPWQQGDSLSKTNPEIKQSRALGFGYSFVLRVDTKPFTDIRVRKALQLALDREAIAKSHYGGYVDWKPSGLVTPDMGKDWVTPYDEWPKKLQDEYSYNPERAKELLAEAAADGVFEPNEYGGFDTNVVSTPLFDANFQQIVKSYFMDIGVDTEINLLPDVPALMQYMMSGQANQMLCLPHTSPAGSPVTTLQFRTTGHDRNNGMVSDPYYDTLYDQFVAATDIKEAQRLCKEADLYALQQHWTIRACRAPHLCLWQSYVKGYMGENIAETPAMRSMLSKMWIDQELKESMGR